MKLNRTIIIDEAEFSGLYEEILAVTDTEITDIDGQSEEGSNFKKRFPSLYKLHNILKSEMIKEQTTYTYERLNKGE